MERDNKPPSASAAASEPSEASSWKQNITGRQLERKRLADKMNQRRARRESKRAKADLEEKLQLIAEGRHTELNRRLMDENKALRGALQQLRAKVESTFLHMKDCVDDGDELMADLIAQSSRRGASSGNSSDINPAAAAEGSNKSGTATGSNTLAAGSNQTRKRATPPSPAEASVPDPGVAQTLSLSAETQDIRPHRSSISTENRSSEITQSSFNMDAPYNAYSTTEPSPRFIMSPDTERLSLAVNATSHIPSLFFQAASLTVCGETQRLTSKATKTTVQDLLQSIIAWKAINRGTALPLLTYCLQLNKPPYTINPAAMYHTILQSNFYQLVVEALFQQKDPYVHEAGATFNAASAAVPPPVPEVEHLQHGQPSIKSTVQTTLNIMDYERRMVVLCAYEVIVHHKACFKSMLEAIVMFWGQYRFYMFLAFPTEENFLKLPPWLRPTESQLSHDHPQFIDLLAWPRLRERLVIEWPRYDHDTLTQLLVQNFQLCPDIAAKHNLPTASALLFADSKNSDLELHPTFEQIVNDIGSFQTDRAFSHVFPELMPYVTPSSLLSGNLAPATTLQPSHIPVSMLDRRSTAPPVPGFSSAEAALARDLFMMPDLRDMSRSSLPALFSSAMPSISAKSSHPQFLSPLVVPPDDASTDTAQLKLPFSLGGNHETEDPSFSSNTLNLADLDFMSFNF